jgi:hypothetical protein
MTYNLSSEKPVSTFAFQMQPAALQSGERPGACVRQLGRRRRGGALHVESS